MQIASVTIKRPNVFPGNDQSLNGIKQIATQSHIMTKEVVIKRELLDIDMITETERRLRRFDFLGKAFIEIDTISEDQVELINHERCQIRTMDRIAFVFAISK